MIFNVFQLLQMDTIDSKFISSKSGVVINSDKAQSLALFAKRSQFVISPEIVALEKRQKACPDLQSLLNSLGQQVSQDFSYTLESGNEQYQIVASSIRFTYNVAVHIPGHGADWTFAGNQTTPIAANSANGLIPDTAAANRKVYLPFAIITEQLNDVRCQINDQSNAVQGMLYSRMKLPKFGYPILYQLNHAFNLLRKRIVNVNSIGLSENYAAGDRDAFYGEGTRSKFVVNGTQSKYIEEPIYLEGLQENNALVNLWKSDHAGVDLLPPGLSLKLTLSTSDSTSRNSFAEAKLKYGDTDAVFPYFFFSNVMIEYDVVRTMNNPELTDIMNRIPAGVPEDLFGKEDSVGSSTIESKVVQLIPFMNLSYRAFTQANIAADTAGSITVPLNSSPNDPVPDILIVWVGPVTGTSAVGRQTFNRSYLRFARTDCITQVSLADFGEGFGNRSPPFCIYPNGQLDLSQSAAGYKSLLLALNQYFGGCAGNDNRDNMGAFEFFCMNPDTFTARAIGAQTIADDGIGFPIDINKHNTPLAILRPSASENMNRDFHGQRTTGSCQLTVTWNNTVKAGDTVHAVCLYRHSVGIKIDSYTVGAAPVYQAENRTTVVSGMFIDEKSDSRAGA